MDNLTITEVARRAGLRPSALRYYEDAGLLPPPARVSGRRRYDAGVLEQLAVIRLAQAAGFTIAETRTFLHGFAPDTPPPDRWQALAAEKLPAVEALIVRAQAMKGILEAGLRCECLALEECARLLGDERIGGREEAWTD
jgi:MerR family redox-sensitive transcriptional activator SoxR